MRFALPAIPLNDRMMVRAKKFCSDVTNLAWDTFTKRPSGSTTNLVADVVLQRFLTIGINPGSCQQRNVITNFIDGTRRLPSSYLYCVSVRNRCRYKRIAQVWHCRQLAIHPSIAARFHRRTVFYRDLPSTCFYGWKGAPDSNSVRLLTRRY